MALEITEKADGKILEVHISDKLTKEDYLRFVPEAERLIGKHGTIRVLFDMTGFHGWEVGALWEDIKFDSKHHSDLERIAMVGDKKWEEWMAKFCGPFTQAEIKYFDHESIEQASTWLGDGLAA
ncbi:MAG: STAS/SEC14 domain-containing protein [Verrucomicrobiales bacterium]